MPKYFKKCQPRQPIVLSDGSGFLAWVVVDHETGILATDDSRMIREFQICIQGRRGGVEEISAEEFLELQSKKKENLKPLWREEWQPRKLAPTVTETFQRPPAEPAEDSQARKPVSVPENSAQHFRPTTQKT